jgi:hypothetical protein
LHDLLVPNLRSLVKKGAVGAACRMGASGAPCTTRLCTGGYWGGGVCVGGGGRGGGMGHRAAPGSCFVRNCVRPTIRVHPMLHAVRCPNLKSLTGGMILDGGTESGVMSMVGSALRFAPPRTVRIVGVCPKELVALPNAASNPPDSTPLEPHHSSFMLVPSREVGGGGVWKGRVWLELWVGCCRGWDWRCACVGGGGGGGGEGDKVRARRDEFVCDDCCDGTWCGSGVVRRRPCSRWRVCWRVASRRSPSQPTVA